MKASELFVRALENEDVEYIFGVPGEENIHVMDALLDSDIRFILCRHEQGAAFMADVYGRLTGEPGVCLATLGPGATNLITGFSDANMDNAPIIAIAGQGATTRMHKESHQILNLVRLFEPISKYSVGIRSPKTIPEVVRKAFKVAKTEKPGGCFMDLPEDVASADLPVTAFLPNDDTGEPAAQLEQIEEAAEIISGARFPIVMAGNGIVRARACAELVSFAENLNIPVANTFMAKGCMPFSHRLSFGTVGLQARDYVACGFARADVVICVGYDIVEYHPYLWHPDKDKKIVHIDACVSEVDEHYVTRCEVTGDVGVSLERIAERVKSRSGENYYQKMSEYSATLRSVIVDEFARHADDDGFPVKPQKILSDIRQVLGKEDIVISDVGAHKMWVARMYQAEAPNTCIISNGFASMGIGVPGAIAAKLVHPDRNVLTVTGDAGFMMNSQEIETAVRIGTPIVIIIWRDDGYGLIRWHQLKAFGRDAHIDFNNPDFVKYAESFGARGFRVGSAGELRGVLEEAVGCGTVAIVDCPVDYSENMKFTEEMGQLVCPI